MRRQALFLILFCGCASTQALTLRDVEYTCPLDGKKFTAKSVMSQTRFGKCLDMKPFGALVAPMPLPKCPESGFVMYKAKFSDAELAKIRAYVASKEYQELRKVNTDYAMAALIQGLLDEPVAQRAFTLLQASWEAKSSTQYKEYALEAVKVLRGILNHPKAEIKKEQRIAMSFVLGELLRRLGEFEAAEKHFSTLLSELTAAGGANETQKAILDTQYALIKKKDIQSYTAPQKGRLSELCP